jgi:hypothetical protein
MKLSVFAVCGLAVSLSSFCEAANVYVLSSGDTLTDDAVVNALTSRGHTVTVGVEYTAFDGTQNLSGFQTVYLQCNANWTSGYMPVAGQQQLVAWVNGGGRLVTSEWVIYYSYANGSFGGLAPIIPVEQSYTYSGAATTTYTSVTPSPAINAGLPAAFSFPLTSFTGTETYSVTKSGAVEYYSTSNTPGGPGLSGWAAGSGFVFSFTSTCGRDQLADTNFGRLFANVMGASSTGGTATRTAMGPPSLPVLNVGDYICFMNKYAAADSYANCDGSTAPRFSTSPTTSAS